MACHRLILPEESRAAEKIESICFHCHAQLGTPAQTLTGKKISLVNPAEYGKTPHAKVACVTCHPQATETATARIFTATAAVPSPYHDEKVAHDLHGVVACGSCHLQGTQPGRDPRSKHVIWKRAFKPGQASRVHQMVIRTMRPPAATVTARTIRWEPPPWSCRPRASSVCPVTREPSPSATPRRSFL